MSELSGRPTKQSRGGTARAKKLTRDQRREIAQLAARARWERVLNPNEVPVVDLPGKLPIGDVEIDVYRLKDGRRLISKAAMAQTLNLKSEGGNAFLRSITRPGLRSMIDENLWTRIESPIFFKVLSSDPNSSFTITADGYEANTLIDVCDAILRGESR